MWYYCLHQKQGLYSQNRGISALHTDFGIVMSAKIEFVINGFSQKESSYIIAENRGKTENPLFCVAAKIIAKTCKSYNNAFSAPK